MLIQLNPLPSHGIHRLLKAVNYFLKSSVTDTIYSLDLFPKWFKIVVQENPSADTYFKDVFEAMHAPTMSLHDRQLIFAEFRGNNRIKRLCRNKAVPLKHRDELAVRDAMIVLFKYLWKDFIGGVCFKNNIGDIDEHYQLFRKNQLFGICPFCGLSTLPNGLSEERAEYDHYLCKSLYPLSSINFRNLIPTCRPCNGKKIKGDTHVICTNDGKKQRRFAFYPFDSKLPSISIETSRQGSCWPVRVSCPSHGEEVETWNDVYKINARYQEYIELNVMHWLPDFIEDQDLRYKSVSSWELRIKLSVWVGKFKNKSKRVGWWAELAYFEYLVNHASEPYLKSICMAIKNGYEPVI